MNFLALPFYTGSLSSIVQSASSPAESENVAMFADTSGLLISDSGLSRNLIFKKDGSLPMTGTLNLDGNESITGHIRPRDDNGFDIGSTTKRFKRMHSVDIESDEIKTAKLLAVEATISGDLDMSTSNIFDVGTINGKTADNIVSNTSTGAAGNLPTFVSDKVIGDSGVALSSLATTSDMTTADSLRVLKAGDSMSGTLNMGTNSITNVTTLNGVSAANIVSNTSTGDAGNLPTFVSAKVIGDSGVALSSLATTSAMTTADSQRLLKAGDTMSGTLNMNSNAITNVSTLNGITTTNLVSGPASSTSGELTVYTGTTGKVLSNSGIPGGNVVQNTASVPVANRMTKYNSTVGNVITYTSFLDTDVALTTGATFTGNVGMGANNITGTGSISANTLSAASTTDSSSVSTGAITILGGLGVAKKAFIGTKAIIGPTQTITTEQMLTLRGPVNQALTGPHMTAYVSTNEFPVFQNLNWQHDSISLSFDGYFDGGWKSSTTTSNFQITKSASNLTFAYGADVVAGATLPWATAGSISKTGTLDWSKTVSTTENLSVGATTGGYGGGAKVISINNASSVPTFSNTNGGILYVNGGTLYWRGSAGTITALGNA